MDSRGKRLKVVSWVSPLKKRCKEAKFASFIFQEKGSGSKICRKITSEIHLAIQRENKQLKIIEVKNLIVTEMAPFFSRGVVSCSRGHYPRPLRR